MVRMISTIFLYKNHRFIRIFSSGSSPITDEICYFRISYSGFFSTYTLLCSRSAFIGLSERFGSFQAQHKPAHDHQRTSGITITSAATARNIRLIVKTRLFRHTRAWHIMMNITIKAHRHTTVSV